MFAGDFSEGVFIDYRDFMRRNVTPRYEFGYGLTYTAFKYTRIDTALLSFTTRGLDVSVWPAPSPLTEGGNPNLFTSLVTVDVTVQNTGSMGASEVVQLYVGIPGSDVPLRQLRGFVKTFIERGSSITAHFELTRRDLSVWNTMYQEWELRRGEYALYVGASVLDIRLNGTFYLSDPMLIGD